LLYTLRSDKVGTHKSQVRGDTAGAAPLNSARTPAAC